MSYELQLGEERRNFNPVNGRFLKGSTPHNKGKKWSEWAGKRAQRRMAKGWRNLQLHRGCGNIGEAVKRKVIGIASNGNWCCFESSVQAAEKTNSRRDLISRTCRWNHQQRVNKKTGKINTDYEHNGVRWYYEDDEQWMSKIP